MNFELFQQQNKKKWMKERKMHKFNGLQHFNCFAEK